jgi:xylulokinase
MSTKATSFLGLDLSTQQLKAVLLSEYNTVVHKAAVHFEKDLPNYGTNNGTIQGPSEGEFTSPVSMWLEAIDLLMTRMQNSGVNFGEITSVCGAAQVSESIVYRVMRLRSIPTRKATWFSLLVYRCRKLPGFSGRQ